MIAVSHLLLLGCELLHLYFQVVVVAFLVFVEALELFQIFILLCKLSFKLLVLLIRLSDQDLVVFNRLLSDSSLKNLLFKALDFLVFLMDFFN